MRIYFGFTMAGDRSSIDSARQIVEFLDRKGYEVLTRHLVNDDARQADQKLGPQQVFNRDMAWLAESEIFIGEVSGSSFGMGYEAGYVLGSSDKRVVMFYRREIHHKISFLITGNTHPNCSLHPYSSFDEIEEVLSELLSFGEVMPDSLD